MIAVYPDYDKLFWNHYSNKLLWKLEATSLATIAVTLNIGLVFNHTSDTNVLFHVLIIFLLLINVLIMVAWG